MHYRNLLLCALFAIMFVACKKNSSENHTIKGDYLIVGWAGRFTTPETKLKYYLIDSTGLYVDSSYTAATTPNNASTFRFVSRMPDSVYVKVKNLPSNIPGELKGKNNQTIGGNLPDGGYRDIRTMKDGTLYFWKIEAGVSGLSSELQAFVQKIDDNL